MLDQARHLTLQEHNMELAVTDENESELLERTGKLLLSRYMEILKVPEHFESSSRCLMCEQPVPAAKGAPRPKKKKARLAATELRTSLQLDKASPGCVPCAHEVGC